MEAEVDKKVDRKKERHYDFIVIDNGSGYVKAGFSGEDAPRVVLPSLVHKTPPSEPGRPTITKLSNELDLNDPPEDLELPIQRGTIQDTEASWESMRYIWEHIITEDLQTDPSNANVLVTDSIFNTRDNKLKIAQIFFDRIGVRSLGIMPAEVLSLFSTGRTLGIVVDSGDGITSVVPVFEGFALTHALKKLDLAGSDLTKFIQTRLETEISPSQLEVARKIKENMLVVPNNMNQALEGPDLIKENQTLYELPGGRIISVDKETRLKAAEALFDPKIVGSEEPSISDLVKESLLKCDEDLREDMASSIVLSGGTSMIPGLQERLELELKAKMRDYSGEIAVHSDSFRKHAAWIGGSMLSSFSTYCDYMVIEKSTWETEGIVKPSLIHKYTF